MSPEEKFLQLAKIPPAIQLPDHLPFTLFRLDNELLYLSGHGSGWGNDFSVNNGKIGKDLSIDEGIIAAKTCALNLLQTTRTALGSLNAVDQIIEVFGMVNCTPEFQDHSKIINGCSDLLVSLFNDKGKHTRVAMGCNSLPFNFSVEIKMTLKTLRK